MVKHPDNLLSQVDLHMSDHQAWQFISSRKGYYRHYLESLAPAQGTWDQVAPSWPPRARLFPGEWVLAHKVLDLAHRVDMEDRGQKEGVA